MKKIMRVSGFWVLLICLILSRSVLAQISSQPAQLTSPQSGTSFPLSNTFSLPVTFQWTAGSNVSQYQLTIGSSSGTNDIYNGSPLTGQSATVNIPNGHPLLYVNIWSKISGTLVQGTELVYPATQTGTLYFVDQNSNDSNPSTTYSTIQAALLASKSITDNDVHIIVRAGTYYVNQTIVLDSSYSGNNNKTLYIQAYPGEKPVISGGYLLPETIPANTSSTSVNQWTYALTPADKEMFTNGKFKRLRVGNNMAVRARYPAYNPNGTVSKATFENAFPAQAASYGDNIYNWLQANNYLDSNGNLLISPTTVNSLAVPNPISEQFTDSGEYSIILGLLKEAPFTSGILFNDWCGNPWEKGQFNYWIVVGQTGEQLSWNINAQARPYHVWLRYFWAGGSQNNSFQLTTDSSQALTVNLASTGLNNYAWVDVGTVTFSSAGAHTLNLSGGSQGQLELDAMILTSDANFNPLNNQYFVINGDGSATVPLSYTANNPTQDLLIIQAESANSVTGTSSSPYEYNFNSTSIPVNGFSNTMCFHQGTYPTSWLSNDWNNAVLYYFPASIGYAAGAVITGQCPPGDTTNCPSNTNGSVTINAHSWGTTTHAGDRFYIENVKKALWDQNNNLIPNEWFLDASTETLYYNVPPNTPSQQLIASTVNTIFQLQGTSSGNISNIVIDGLTFMDTDYPDWNPSLSNQGMPAISYTLELDFANNITIKNNAFENVGSYAIGLENSSNHNFIYANTLNNLGGGGIGIGYNSVQDTSSNDNIVSFNNISNIGRIFRVGTGGVIVNTGSNNLVSNNNITDSSFSGMIINMQDGNRSNGNLIEYNDIIDTDQEGNDMGGIYITSGNVYTGDSATGFKYNFIKNTGGVCSTSGGGIAITPCYTKGIYTDTMTSGLNIYGNVVENAGSSFVGGNGVKDVSISNNIFYNSLNEMIDFGNWYDSLQNFSVTNNIFDNPSVTTACADNNCVYALESLGGISQTSLDNALGSNKGGSIYTCLSNSSNGYFDQYGHVMVDLSLTSNQSALAAVIQQCGDSSASDFQTVLSILQQAQYYKIYFGIPGNESAAPIDDNVYYGINTANYPTPLGPTWSSWTSAGYDTHSLIQDPLFVDPTHQNIPGTLNDNFTLQDTSPALALGFQQIPLNKIGNSGYPITSHAPVLTPVGTQTTAVGQQVSFTVNASSVDQDIQSLTMLNPPQGFSFDYYANNTTGPLLNASQNYSFVVNSSNTSGTFTWTPNEPGSYQVSFLVQDNHGLADIMTVTVNVTGNIEYSWPFNDGSGLVANETDTMGFSFNSALLYFNWACTPSAGCANGASGWTTGISGNALLLNNNYADHIVIPNSNYNLFPLNNGAFSISFIFKVNSLSTNAWNGIMINGTYSIDGFRMGINNGGGWGNSNDFVFWSTQSGGTLTVPGSNNLPSDSITTGKWYQAVVSYNNTGTCPSSGNGIVNAPCATLYLNGQVVDGRQGQVLSSLSDLLIGTESGFTSCNMLVENLNIYNKALNSQEVSAIYNISNLPDSRSTLLGDVIGTEQVSIYDAELTAQYSIGLPVANFIPANAKVDGNSSVDIYDAYLIAEYSIGIIKKFPIQE